MAITNFIPTIWSENLYKALDQKYVGVANSNRDYDGEIKGMGSVVKICGVDGITVSDYTKNTDMSSPQTLSDTVKELTIDRAKYFNFQIDDVDRAQAMPKLMDAAMSVAANALANEADKAIYREYINAGVSHELQLPNYNTLFEYILKSREHLFEHGVTDPADIVVEVSPAVASLLLMAKTEMITNNVNEIENGYIGNIYGCKVYVSNNIIRNVQSEFIYHYCLVRTRRAIAFAEQLSEIDAYRPEKRFADAVKGLHLYGIKTVYPNELICLSIGFDNYDYEG